jgi:hypothetical protein
VQRADELVALALEPRRDLREPLLDPLRPRVGDLCKPFGEDGFRLAREHVDGAVELARQPAGGVLARALHGRVELQCCRLGEAPGSLVCLSLQRLHLTTLDICEAALDPLGDIDLLALDAFEEAPVARLEALSHLLGRAPPFRSVSLELGADRGGGPVGRVLELFSELGECGCLEVPDLVDLGAIGLDSRLRVDDERLLPLPELGELAG